MAVFDQADSGRTEITDQVLARLLTSVDWNRHRMVVVDNNSCEATKQVLRKHQWRTSLHILTSPENIGTARAINKAWQHRRPDEHAIKMDNDCMINFDNWIEEMEEVVTRDPSIGIVGLKRKDLMEHPGAEGGWKSTLEMLPHIPGQAWKVVEMVNHVMGTCQFFSAGFLKEFGYLSQPRLYGFDDSLACAQAKLLGYRVGFIPWIDNDHLDPADVMQKDYTAWKFKIAGEDHAAFSKLVEEYESGKRPLYEQP